MLLDIMEQKTTVYGVYGMVTTTTNIQKQRVKYALCLLINYLNRFLTTEDIRIMKI